MSDDGHWLHDRFDECFSEGNVMALFIFCAVFISAITIFSALHDWRIVGYSQVSLSLFDWFLTLNMRGPSCSAPWLLYVCINTKSVIVRSFQRARSRDPRPHPASSTRIKYLYRTTKDSGLLQRLCCSTCANLSGLALCSVRLTTMHVIEMKTK